MRLALLVSLVALSAAPHAQVRFQAMCESSAADASVDSAAICSCAVDRVVALGGSVSALDAVADFMAAEIDLEDVPDDVMATSNAATSAIYACRSEAGIGTASDSALKSRLEGQGAALEGVGLEGAPLTPEAIAAQAAAASVQTELPPGIRTGNGNVPVQARQLGKGAPIRIVG